MLIDGQRAALEAKPMELLHELLLQAGKVVTKDELLDRIWPNVIVVEASLPTAVRKLRLALRDDQQERTIVETVAGMGYRLAVPVEVERCSSEPTAPNPAAAGRAADRRSSGTAGMLRVLDRGTRLRWLARTKVALAVLVFAVALGVGRSQQIAPSTAQGTVSQREAANALRRLDVGAIEAMVAAGWSPNTYFDREGNAAINYVLNMCEWDRNHDRRKMLLMVRTLVDAGGHIDRPNFWGDTAYSIAKAPRYCGPDHPVTEMIRTLCYSGAGAVGDRCLATYELARRQAAPSSTTR